MAKDLLSLLQQDGQNLEEMHKAFAEADLDTKSKLVTDVTNQVAKFINGEITVVFPTMCDFLKEGPQLVQDSLERLRVIALEFDKLEQMLEIEGTGVAAPAVEKTFDQVLARFLVHWTIEDKSVRELKKTMDHAEYALLGPRWVTAEATAPSNPRKALESSIECVSGSASAKSTASSGQKTQGEDAKGQDPTSSSSASATAGTHPGTRRTTFSQRMHRLVDTTQEMMSRVHISKPGFIQGMALPGHHKDKAKGPKGRKGQEVASSDTPPPSPATPAGPVAPAAPGVATAPAAAVIPEPGPQ